LNKYIKWNFRG